jgi:hypothetical protein
LHNKGRNQSLLHGALYSVRVHVIKVQLRRDQSVFSVAPTKAEASSHPGKGSRHFTEISGARSNYNSEVLNNYTCECKRDCPIIVLAKSETRLNLLVAFHRRHATICWHLENIQSNNNSVIIQNAACFGVILCQHQALSKECTEDILFILISAACGLT